VERIADVVKALPDFEWTLVRTQDPELPCLISFSIFEYEGLSVHPRCHSWCVPNLRVVGYGMDKGYSRAISRLAIPRLLNEINVLREPQQAVERFSRILALDPISSGVPVGNAGSYDENTLEEYFKQILN